MINWCWTIEKSYIHNPQINFKPLKLKKKNPIFFVSLLSNKYHFTRSLTPCIRSFIPPRKLREGEGIQNAVQFNSAKKWQKCTRLYVKSNTEKYRFNHVVE